MHTKHLRLSLVLLGSLSVSGAVHAEELVGLVDVAGNAVTTRMKLLAPGETDGPLVCTSNDTGKKIKRLGAMTVKVAGDWKTNKKGEKSCFAATDFTVLKTSSGRDALVGTLSQTDSVYVVTNAEGKTHLLEDIPTGLKKLNGQKVILDIKQISSPTAKGELFKVVSYAAHP